MVEMKDESVCFREVVQLFIHDIYPDIKKEYEVPKFFIKFPLEGYELFFDLLINPYTKDNCYIPRINKSDIDNLEVIFDNVTPVMFVRDVNCFFTYLTEIINELLLLYKKYNTYTSARHLGICVLKRIWLRMGPDDFMNVEEFLRKQLEFIKNNIFFSYKEESFFSNFYEADIYVKNNLNHTWDESSQRFEFTLKNYNEVHSLPSIYYGILNDGKEDICYLYVIQNKRDRIKSSKLERLCYRLNEGILELEDREYLEYRNGYSNYYPENIVDVHPSQVLSFLCFVELLKKHQIYHIKVPVLQVLSYDYHEKLSKKAKEEFPKIYSEEKIASFKYLSDSSRKRLEMEYEWDRKWYDHVVDKEDVISENKIDTLIRIIRRSSYHNEEIVINSEPMITGDYLDIKIVPKIKNNERLKSKILSCDK